MSRKPYSNISCGAEQATGSGGCTNGTLCSDRSYRVGKPLSVPRGEDCVSYLYRPSRLSVEGQTASVSSTRDGNPNAMSEISAAKKSR